MIIRLLQQINKPPPYAPKRHCVRAKIVIDLVKQFFHEYLFVTQENYDGYVAIAREELSARRKHINSVMSQSVIQLHEVKKRYEEEKNLIRDNPTLAPYYSLDDRQGAITKLEDFINKKKDEKRELSEVILPFKEYLKLFENIGVILEDNNDMAQLDAIIKFFF